LKSLNNPAFQSPLIERKRQVLGYKSGYNIFALCSLLARIRPNGFFLYPAFLARLAAAFYSSRMPREPSIAHQFESMAQGLLSTGLTHRMIGREAKLAASTVFRAAVGDSRCPSAESFSKLETVWRKHGSPRPRGEP